VTLIFRRAPNLSLLESAQSRTGGAAPHGAIVKKTRQAKGKADVLARMDRFNRGRDPDLLKRKCRAMRADPFAFLRGTAHLFYDLLADWKTFRKASR
jgi:hypothetical protein